MLLRRCVLCVKTGENDVTCVHREMTITQQPAGVTGSYAYGRVAVGKESLILMTLECPGLINMPKNINAKNLVNLIF